MAELQQHPDLKFTGGSQPSHLTRNKTERRRLQGLQRSNTTGSITQPTPNQVKSLKQRFDLWMINEGGRRLFFFVWILLHLLVAVFGFLNYQLKDNSDNARATFGVTFRMVSLFLAYSKPNSFTSYCPHSCPGPSRRCHFYPPPCVPELYLVVAPHPLERHHSFR